MYRRPNKGESKTDYLNVMMADADVRQRFPHGDQRRQFLENEYSAGHDDKQAPEPVTLETFKEPEPEPAVEDDDEPSEDDDEE